MGDTGCLEEGIEDFVVGIDCLAEVGTVAAGSFARRVDIVEVVVLLHMAGVRMAAVQVKVLHMVAVLVVEAADMVVDLEVEAHHREAHNHLAGDYKVAVAAEDIVPVVDMGFDPGEEELHMAVAADHTVAADHKGAVAAAEEVDSLLVVDMEVVLAEEEGPRMEAHNRLDCMP